MVVLIPGNFDPIYDLYRFPHHGRSDGSTVPSAIRVEHPTPNRIESPEDVLRRRKQELGVNSWERIALMAHLKLAEHYVADAQAYLTSARAAGAFQQDSIYCLLRGRNLRPERTKALAAALGVDWRALDWIEWRKKMGLPFRSTPPYK